MDRILVDKVAIVTGAGRGIGEAIARKLATAGVHVAVHDINPDRADKVAHSIREGGGAAISVAADVSNRFHCVNLIETTRAEWGRLDAVVNQASVRPSASILKMDEWDWDRCLDVNLKAIFFMSQLCGRVMAEAGSGIIINVGSTAGLEEPLAEHAAYCASMAGIVGFGRECSREFAPYGVRVQTILRKPGMGEEKEGKIANAVLAAWIRTDTERTSNIITLA